MNSDFKAFKRRVSSQVWYEKPNGSYIFLTQEPLTFGHSQLRMVTKYDWSEEIAYIKASQQVGKAIAALTEVLANQCVQEQFPALSNYTGRKGAYIKTAVLRVSAEEARNEYKVHLCPIWESGLEKSGELLRRSAPWLPEGQNGGLINWLGHRETLTYTDAHSPETKGLFAQKVEEWRLPSLASLLRAVAMKS